MADGEAPDYFLHGHPRQFGQPDAAIEGVSVAIELLITNYKAARGYRYFPLRLHRANATLQIASKGGASCLPTNRKNDPDDPAL